MKRHILDLKSTLRMHQRIAVLLIAGILGIPAMLQISLKGQVISQRLTPEEDILTRFDLNGNGRIDVEERTKEFVREQTRLRLAFAKAKADERGRQGGLKLDNLKLPSPTRAQFIGHDTNGNGQLEPEERIRLEATLREELVRRFQIADVNCDGVLDRNEARSMRVGVRSSGSLRGVSTPAP